MENPFEVIIERLDRIEKLLLQVLEAGSTTTRQNFTDEKYVYGLQGLMELLNCSRSTALKLKSSGKIPYHQVGRKLIFERINVLNALIRNK